MNAEFMTGSIAVVLCRVEGAMNVGATCRAMKTMGLTRLVLADCPIHDETTVRTHALQAFDVFSSAEHHTTLREALSPFSSVAGFTRRTGQWRKDNIGVQDYAARLAGRSETQVALVFGNERDGLSDAELSQCDEAVSLDTSGLFPSLNLSHAVQIACWEVRKALSGSSLAAGVRVCANHAATESAARQMADALQSAGFFKIAGRPEAEIFLRSIAARAALSDAELARFTAFFVKLGAVSVPVLDRVSRQQ
jgi:TrmH family RNA methyltransferase